MGQVRGQITDYVKDLLREQGYDDPVSIDTSLILSGLLDSFAVMRLVVFMEREFGISFADEYFDQNIFDTISGMTEYAAERVAKEGS